MSETTIKLLIIAVTYFISAAILFTVPARSRKIKKQLGKNLLKINERKIIIPLLIAVACFVIPLILYLKEFEMLYHVLLCLISILGTFMSSQELVYYKKYGVYSNGIIASSRFIKKEEIYSIPLFFSDEPDEKKYNCQGFKVVLTKKNPVMLVFNSTEECQQVLKALEKVINK